MNNRDLKHGLLLVFIFIMGIMNVNAQSKMKTKQLIRAGNTAFVDSNFTLAEEKYQLALLESKDNFKAMYNLANTLFKQKRYKDAVKAYEDLLEKAPTKEMKANIYHNLGNSLIANQDLEGSIEAYKNALRLNPKMHDTRYNLAYAKELKKQQPQEDKKDKGKRKEDKDKDKGDKDKDKDKDKGDKDKDKDKGDKDKDKDKGDEDKDKDKGDEDKDKEKEETTRKISKKELERLLKAVAEKEKETKEKLEKQKARVKPIKTEKDW